MHVRVECDADDGGEAIPRYFFIGCRRIDLVGVLDRWMSCDDHYYKLRAIDDGIYILHHQVRRNTWEITLFDSGRCEQTRLSST